MIKYSKLDLGRIEAFMNQIGGENGLADFFAHKFILVDPAKTKKSAQTVEPLFTFVGRFSTAGTKEFVAAKNYVVNTSENARVRISYIGGNFKEHLLPKVEHNITASDLTLSKLGRSQHDLPMSDEEPGTIAGLGGLVKAETTLYEFFETLAHKQALGDFSWTVGYVRDDNGVLWAVLAPWHGDGWGVVAFSVAFPLSWNAVHVFVSR